MIRIYFLFGSFLENLKPSFENIYVISSLIFFGSLFFGIAFYMAVNGWDFSLAYFFSASVLLGDMYLLPTETNTISQTFTLFYFLWGTTLLAGAVAATANQLVTSAIKIAAQERKRLLSLNEPEDLERDMMLNTSGLQNLQAKFFKAIGWSTYKSKYLSICVACSWLFIGFLYGRLFEEWTVYQSFFFALSAMSASGSFPPVCEEGDGVTCRFGVVRCLLLGTYLIIGVPIFAYTMGQFAELLVEQAIRANELKLMMSPLTEKEFKIAFNLHSGQIPSMDSSDDFQDNSSRGIVINRQRSMTIKVKSTLSLTLNDFIILELLRLKKIGKDDLECIKNLFDAIDEDKDGVIVPSEARKYGQLQSNNNTGRYGALDTIPEGDYEDIEKSDEEVGVFSPLAGPSLTPEANTSAEYVFDEDEDKLDPDAHEDLMSYNDLILPLIRDMSTGLAGPSTPTPDPETGLIPRFGRSRSYSARSYSSLEFDNEKEKKAKMKTTDNIPAIKHSKSTYL